MSASDLSPLLTLMNQSWDAAAAGIATESQLQVFTAQTAEGDLGIYVVPARNEAEKTVALTLLSLRFAAQRVKRYTVHCECWMAMTSDPDPKHSDPEHPDFIRVSKRPDRIEALWLAGVDPEAGEIMVYWAPIRQVDGERALGEREQTMVGEKFKLGGRALELLGPVKPHAAH